MIRYIKHVVALGALTGVLWGAAPALASASIEHWYVGGTKLSAGVTAQWVSSGGIFTLNWTAVGVSFEVECADGSGSGQIENPIGGGPAVLDSGQIDLEHCVVTKPLSQHCSIAREEVDLVGLKGSALEFEGGPAVRFEPKSGTVFGVIKLEDCKTAGLNGSYPLEGWATAIAHNATHSLEFTEAGDEGVPLIGSMVQETPGGLPIEVKP